MSVELQEVQNSGFRLAAAGLLRNFAARLDGVKPSEGALRRAIAPIHIITDFNNHLSQTECEQKVRAVFQREGVMYETPHTINDIQPFNITDGAFQIYQLVNNLRCERIRGIFVGVIDPGVGSDRRGIVITTNEGYVFVGPDNGLFYPAVSTLTIKAVYRINQEAFAHSSVTFHGRDQFTPIAADIATGKDPAKLPQLSIEQNGLVRKEFTEGQIVESDGYQNLKIWHRGIPEQAGRRARQLIIQTPFCFRGRVLWIQSLKVPVVNTFEDVAVGKWLVYEGSSCRTPENNRGLIELAIRDKAGKDGAGGRLGVITGDILKLSWIY